MIRFNEPDNKSKIGAFEEIDSKPGLEVVLGDQNQRYKSPKVDEHS
jgi:hypothetical protein